MEFKDMKCGQMFTVPGDPVNVWSKIPLMKEPVEVTLRAEDKIINAVLLNGNGEDAVFEFFADDTMCDCMTLEFEKDEDDDEDEDDGGVDPRLAE